MVGEESSPAGWHGPYQPSPDLPAAGYPQSHLPYPAPDGWDGGVVPTAAGWAEVAPATPADSFYRAERDDSAFVTTVVNATPSQRCCCQGGLDNTFEQQVGSMY